MVCIVLRTTIYLIIFKLSISTLIMVVLTEKKERLTLDVIGQLEDEVERNPLDYGKWNRLIERVLVKDKEEQIRSVFDRYLSFFRFDAKQWCNYINFELNRGEFNKVELLFAKCLPITNEVELCRTYVSYVRRVNDVITGGEKARSTVVQAFDFAITKVGIDTESGDLWMDYLEFFKSWTPSSSWEQQQKNDLIRKLYKRCLVIPSAKVESMWSDYTKWENDVSNPNSASKYIADLSTEYMEARSWNTEWRNVTRNALRRKLIPISSVDDESNIVGSQLELWYKWLDLEKKNSLKLNEPELQDRIEYVYKQATSLLPFAPEMWFRYNKFLMLQNEEANRSRSIEYLSEGLKLNPRSFLLSFQLSELHEKDNAFPKALEVLNDLIKILSGDHEEIQLQIDLINTKAAQRTSGSQAKTPSTTPKKPKDPDSMAESDSEDETDNLPVVLLTETEVTQILELESKLKELNKAVTLVYIKLMALSKRSQGIKEVRSVFKQRKNFKPMGFEFYVENALIEYYSDNKKIADKVFDLAMKSFNKSGEFLYAYLKFLILTNSIEAIKAFFEMALTNLLKEISSDKEALELSSTPLLQKKKKTDNLKSSQYYMKKIIKTYMKFASNYLDLDTVMSLELRYIQFFSEDDELSLFIDRYKSDNFDGIAKYDLGDKFTVEEEEEEDDKKKSRKRRKVTNDYYSPEPRATPERDNGTSSNILGLSENSFVGKTILGLLQILPNAGYFGPPPEHIFNSTKLVELFGNLPDSTD